MGVFKNSLRYKLSQCYFQISAFLLLPYQCLPSPIKPSVMANNYLIFHKL